MVSVSRVAGPPQQGQVVLTQSVWRASGDSPSGPGSKSVMSGRVRGRLLSGTGLVEQAAKQCYGIAAMGQAPAESVVRSALRTGSLPPKGVTVTQEGGKLVIALHIKVGFGLNISTITQSITHRVKDEVELATGLKVARIDVYVDDVIAD